MTRASRNFGRRKLDKIALGVTVATVVLLTALVVSRCDKGEVSGPTPVASTEPAVVNAPTPAPTAAPTAVDPAQPSGFELGCLPGSTLTVKNNGNIPSAVDTFYTGFDNQAAALGLQHHTIAAGGTIERGFGKVCIQGDADQPGSKLIGGCFYDAKGNPFVPSRNPEKVNECRQCEGNPKKTEVILDAGEWGACQPFETNDEAVTVSQCRKSKTTRFRIDVTACDGTIIEGQPESRTEYEACVCPCVETEQPLEIPGTYSWGAITQDECNPEVLPIQLPTLDDVVASNNPLKCKQVGTQKIGIDWLCKENDERVHNLCRNIPATKFYWYDVDEWNDLNDSQKTALIGKCQGEGGTWFNTFGQRVGVCKTLVNHDDDHDWGVKNGNDDDSDRFDTSEECR